MFFPHFSHSYAHCNPTISGPQGHFICENQLLPFHYLPNRLLYLLPIHTICVHDLNMLQLASAESDTGIQRQLITSSSQADNCAFTAEFQRNNNSQGSVSDAK